MAEDSSGWAKVVEELIRSFEILRDIFGYALPGGVFLGIGVLTGKINLATVAAQLKPLLLPAWAGAILLIAGAYVTGQILAAVAYTPWSIAKWMVWLGNHEHFQPDSPEKRTTPGTALDWLLWHPTEVSPEVVKIRTARPELCSTLERRETLTVLEGAVTIALGAGAFLFKPQDPWRGIIWGGAGFMLITFCTAFAHLKRVTCAVVRARGAPWRS
jgi:hypothetical protein